MVHFETHKTWNNGQEGEDDIIALLKALEKEGLHPAVQVNGILSPDGINDLHAETGAPIVMQLRKEFMALELHDLVAYIDQTRGSIAEVLIDASAGTGKEIDTNNAVTWHYFLAGGFGENLHSGFAGGINGTNAENMITGFRKALGHSKFSIDIETGARSADPKNAGKDLLDLEKVASYAANAREGFAAEL